MQSPLTTPFTVIISLLVLFGWFVSDFRAGDAIDVVIATATNNVTYLAENVAIDPATSSPNIDTNWFTGTTSSVTSQLPAAQSKKSDDDEHIAVGRIMGQSFGSDGDL
ncbi:MAG: hypothetical protein NTV39_04575 [Candidatus Saccharibacteria bacterium]|nr:hypothetical protein [Candidatus Saccharibacteria bacterium]